MPTGTASRCSLTKAADGAGTPQPGAWNCKGTLAGFDHLDAVGWTLSWGSLGWYRTRVDELRALQRARAAPAATMPA